MVVAETQEQEAPRGSQERLEISSGELLIIDQFMLANPQLFQRRDELLAEGNQPENALRLAAEQYGGCVVRLPSGPYTVYRDPHETVIALAPEHGWEELNDEDETAAEKSALDIVLEARGNAESTYRVFVDTRCVVFLDASMVGERGVMQKYADLRHSGDEKRARDFLREQGGAVRYGFNRYGDELGVFKIKGGEIIALWPDVVD